MIHHVDAPQYSYATIGALPEIFLIVLVPEAPCFLAPTQARRMGLKSDYGLKKFLLPVIGHTRATRDLIHGDGRPRDATAMRSFAPSSFLKTAKKDVHRSRAPCTQI
jgi:hypothetical protein